MNVEEFLKKMDQQVATPMTRNNAQTKSLEKISLNYMGNYGRYQIIPFDNVVNDYPFVKLDNTREICIPRKFTNKDGVEVSYQDWIKILPKAAYIMKDSTGRVVSSLTSDEDRILSEAYSVFDQLFTEIDAKNNRDAAKDLLRKRNYTIFHAYCLNKWNFEDSRTAVRQNFPGLFVATAKSFVSDVNSNIDELAITEGADKAWLGDIYSNATKDLKGFMMFSINRAQTGYTVTVNHKPNAANALQGVEIPAEDAALIKDQDPLATFLGRQANYEEGVTDPTQRRLFNTALIKEAIAFMTQQLAAIRIAKGSGADVQSAIKATSDAALAGATSAPQTNDPMLQAQVAAPQVNTGNIQANNNSPFQTPPVMHADPLTSGPAQGFGQAQPANPFANNGFGAGFGQAAQAAGNNGDLPF